MNTLEHFREVEMVYRLGWTLVHSLWLGAIVAALLSAALVMLRRRSPQARYLVACAALGLIVAAPLATFPLVSAPVPAAPAAVARVTGEAAVLPAARLPVAPAVTAPAENLSAVAPAPAEEGGFAAAVVRVSHTLEPALPWLTLAWLCGVLALSLWRLAGWMGAQRLRRLAAPPSDPTFAARLNRLARALRVSRPVRLLESTLVRGPVVIGWLKPVILMPAGLATGLSADQVEAVLAHELAHIRRLDYLVNLLQAAAETTLFYHPAVWWVSRRIRAERENCCDDMAVAVLGNPVRYAEALTAVASIGPSSSRAAAVALGSPGRELINRIRRLLGMPDPACSSVAASATAVVLVLAMLAITITVSVSCRGAGARPAASTTPSGDAKSAAVEPKEIEIKTNGGLVVVYETNKNDAGKVIEQIGITWRGKDPITFRAKTHPGYIIGRSYTEHLFLDGKEVPFGGGGMGGAWEDEGRGVSYLPPELAARVLAGAKMRVTADVEVFETSEPTGHMWQPTAGDYKVLWKGQVEGTYTPGPRAAPPVATTPTAPAGSFAAKVEQVLSLSKAPHTADVEKLPDLFVPEHPGSKSYEFREGTIGARHLEDIFFGEFFYLPGKDAFYVQHDGLGSSTRTYYGPFKGKPWEVLAAPEMERWTIPSWGEASEGLQARLMARKPQWKADEQPAILVTVRNGSTKDFNVDYHTPAWEVECDGRWYHYIGRPHSGPPVSPVKPNEERADIHLLLYAPAWVEKSGEELPLTPGKHTIRVASNPTSAEPADAAGVRVVSNPVEIEILPPPAGVTKPADAGVELKLKADKEQWKAGETPTLTASIGNSGARPFTARQNENEWELEYDGRWYSWIGPLSKEPWAGDLWINVTFGGLGFKLSGQQWALKGGEALALAPGKHKVRIATYVKPTKPADAAAIRTVSNAEDIEILPAPAKAPAPVSEAKPAATPAAEAAGLKGEVRLFKDKLAYDETPSFVVTLTNTSGQPIDVIGTAQSEIDKDKVDYYPCFMYSIDGPGRPPETYYTGGVADTNPHAVRIEPGKSWTFQAPTAEAAAKTAYFPFAQTGIVSLSWLLPGKYTANIIYAIREDEKRRLGPALVYGPEWGNLAGRKPDRLWQGVVRASAQFEVVDDNSKPVSMLKAVHAGAGRKDLRLELSQFAETGGKAMPYLKLMAVNAGKDTLYLGSGYTLTYIGPDGKQASDFGGEHSGSVTVLELGQSVEWWGFRSQPGFFHPFVPGFTPPPAPGRYQVWAQYFTPDGKDLVAESNKLTVEVPATPATTKPAATGTVAAATASGGEPNEQADYKRLCDIWRKTEPEEGKPKGTVTAEERALLLQELDGRRGGIAPHDFRRMAAITLGNLKAQEAVAKLVARLADGQENGMMRAEAAGALGKIGDKIALAPLLNALADPRTTPDRGSIRLYAARAIRALAPTAQDLAPLATAERFRAMLAAVEAIGLPVPEPESLDLSGRSMQRYFDGLEIDALCLGLNLTRPAELPAADRTRCANLAKKLLQSGLGDYAFNPKDFPDLARFCQAYQPDLYAERTKARKPTAAPPAGKAAEKAKVGSAAGDHPATETHALTWEVYDGTGDPATAVYVLDGERLGRGAAGLEALRQRITKMPRGAEVLIHPYYGDPGSSVRLQYPFSTQELSRFAKERGVMLGVPLAG
jgi:beta-lactamase regulating signal transducer with metallopeptidase domain